MQPSLKEECSIRLLRTERRFADPVTVDYELYQVVTPGQRYFAVEIQTNEDCELQILGHDRTRADCFFEKLVCGTVTPCTLGELLCEMQKEEGAGTFGA